MGQVDDYIKEKMLKNSDFKFRYEIIKQKVEVAKKIVDYRISITCFNLNLPKKSRVSQQYISKIDEGEFSNIDTVENILNQMGYSLKLEVISLSNRN